MSFPAPSEKQARVIWSAITGFAVAVLLALLVGLLWGLGLAIGRLSPVLMPLAVAGVIAYLLDPVVDRFESRGLPRTRAILCVFALALVLVVGLFASVVPQLVVETRQLARKIPTYAQRIQTRVEDWVSHPPAPLLRFLHVPVESPGLTNAPPAANDPSSTPTTTTNPPPAPGDLASTNQVGAAPAQPAARGGGGGGEALAFLSQYLDPDLLQSATGWLAKVVPQIGSWLFGQVSKVASWFGVLAGLALVPIYTFYFLLEKRGIESNWTDYLPLTKSEFKDELVFVLNAINNYLIAFFRGQVLVAICDGVLYTIGFLIIGLPYAVLIGVMATFLTIIPFLGAIVTCATALIVAFVQFGDWLHPLLVLAVFAVVQALEGLVISPKIMGDRVGLHPLTIIIAVMVGTTLMGGLIGGILAIPLTAALRVLMFRYVWRRRET
ncbi:MAG: AI-2E family transporter [Verrucomicrobia bacterium]|nr:AI-2E family transporter [Verrucomicrobiota bacterium]